MTVSDREIDNLLSNIIKLHPKSIDLGLSRTLDLLEKLDNPHNKLSRIVLFSGTNGKHSFGRYLQEIIKFNGKSTNHYSSPHLIRFAERFCINDQIINNEDLFSSLDHVLKINKNNPASFFELTTCAFFYAAVNKAPNVYANLIEVGLGGRLDSTNCTMPYITAINNIGYDHAEYLSNDIHAISFEKAGITRKGVKCIIGKQTYPEAKQILIDQCKHKGSPIKSYGDDWTITEKGNHLIYEDNKNKISFKQFHNSGDYQKYNLGLAIATAVEFEELNVKEFLDKDEHTKVYMPGRFNRLSKGKLLNLVNDTNEIIIDGCHQSLGSKAFNNSLQKLKPKQVVLIVGMMSNKSASSFINEIENIKAIRTLKIPDEENSFTADELKHKFSNICKDVQSSHNIEDALTSLSSKYNDATICIIGSLYFAGFCLSKN